MKRGFTLLEMIIVVSVLAILFLLSVPNIQRVMKIVDEKGLRGAAEGHRFRDSAIQADTGQPPLRINDLVSAGLLTKQQTECLAASSWKSARVTACVRQSGKRC